MLDFIYLHRSDMLCIMNEKVTYTHHSNSFYTEKLDLLPDLILQRVPVLLLIISIMDKSFFLELYC